MNTIITKHLFAYNNTTNIPKGIAVNPEDTHKVINTLRAIKKKSRSVYIYDGTKTNIIAVGDKVNVNDHINKSGNNPLIGLQKELDIEFIDLTNLYQRNSSGIITTCYGNYSFDSGDDFPSKFLCCVSILAKALGFYEIHGKLINC